MTMWNNNQPLSGKREEPKMSTGDPVTFYNNIIDTADQSAGWATTTTTNTVPGIYPGGILGGGYGTIQPMTIEQIHQAAYQTYAQRAVPQLIGGLTLGVMSVQAPRPEIEMSPAFTLEEIEDARDFIESFNADRRPCPAH